MRRLNAAVCGRETMPFERSGSTERSERAVPILNQVGVHGRYFCAADAARPNEEMEFDDFLESRGRASSGFGAVNPLHGN